MGANRCLPRGETQGRIEPLATTRRFLADGPEENRGAGSSVASLTNP